VGAASPLGLALDYHERCHRDMEAAYLRGFFVHAVQVGCLLAGVPAGWGCCCCWLGLVCLVVDRLV
jgi:hypothetical protein